ncbi:MAG: NAD(P)H-hydrate dehydratase [Muribaculaceae bacterium]|nr:NAD(P)H-hydrate dehydratase [Muribaculaceae bacterium]
MKIFTSERIRQIDENTLKAQNISVLDLMERAASAISYEIMTRWRPTKRIVIFAGPGNNGGDALAVARILQEQGYHPEVFLFNTKSSSLSACCQTNRDRLAAMPGVYFTEVVSLFTPPELDENDVVIDGLFGSGLRAPLKGGYTSLVQYINDSKAFVVSIDVPSGLFGEWNIGADRRNIIRANLTLALQFKRLSFFFAENAEFIGECKVLNIDMDIPSIDATPTDFYLIEKDDAKASLKSRNQFTGKYDYGTALIVAGSYGMAGAAILAARGASRAGAGLVTVHTPQINFAPLQAAVPEVVLNADRNQYVVSKIEINHDYNVVALGPGIRTTDETISAIGSFFKNYHKPCILEADALNCIASQPILIKNIPKGSVLTPHAAEFDRLFKQHNSEEERLKKAIDVSRLYEITIVLKGHHTMTVRPDGKVYINSSGNAGMATAGSGDVLTGVIAAMMAQGYSTHRAVMLAVYLHGLAGDIAAKEHGQHGLIAPDIAENIGRAIKEVMK